MQTRITDMTTVTIQYWAAAREAAGVDTESVDAQTLAEALDAVVARRGDGARLRAVLAASSFLVDGASAGHRVAADLVLHDAAFIEVLPQFAGGLARSGLSARIAADWGSNALQCPYQHVPKSILSGAP